MQRDMDRAQHSPDGAVLEQLRGRIFLVFGSVLDGPGFDWRLRRVKRGRSEAHPGTDHLNQI